eukprot:m.21650 g.21650  ORF g.21650 m.21650 type:complete len:347 (+) comp8745_c0_seq3:152-1192(+)
MSLKFGTSSEEGGNNMSWNPFADMTAADNDSNNNNSNNSNNNNNSGNESAAMEKKNKAVLSLFGDSSDVDVDVDAVDVDDATEHNRDCDATPTPFSSSKPLNTANEFAPRTSPSSPFVIRSNIVLTEEDNINVVVSPHNSPLKSALSSKSSPRKAQKLSVSFPAKLFVKIDKDGVEEENYVLYQTLYKFESDHPDDLSFEANEILQVIDEGDGPNSWFTGRSQDGRKGVFPGTYVRKIVLRSAPSVSVDVEGGTVKTVKKELQPHEYECYQALYDFEGETDEDLSFKANDIIRVTDTGDGPKSWWKGQNQDGNEGVFPGTFMRKIGGSDKNTQAVALSLAGLEHVK